MENEIKVNEYIRTKRGIIDRVVKISDNYIFLKSKIFITEYGESSTFIKKTDVVKHSSKPIGLIECGDYVNGKLIHKVDIRNNSSYIYYGNCKTFTDYQIETIVTKEQFESISYKVTKM